MSRTNLRAVAPDEKPPSPPAKPKTIIEAAEGGNRRELLVAMRGRIARAVDRADCPPRDLAALTRRLTEIARDIEVIDAADEQEAQQHGSTEGDGRSFDAAAI